MTKILPFEKKRLTAEEAFKKLPISEEEYDEMTVEETLKFHEMLVEAGKMRQEVANMFKESITYYIMNNVVDYKDTNKEANRKILEFWQTGVRVAG